MSKNLIKSNEGKSIVIDSYEIIEKPIGKGFCFDRDASHYEDYLEELNINYHDVIVIYYFDNDLEYYISDTEVMFYDILRGELITGTNETAVIDFSEYEVILLKDKNIKECLINKKVIK